MLPRGKNLDQHRADLEPLTNSRMGPYPPSKITGIVTAVVHARNFTPHRVG